jgi:hypothetical protein
MTSSFHVPNLTPRASVLRCLKPRYNSSSNSMVCSVVGLASREVGFFFVCAALVANADWMTSLFIENDFIEHQQLAPILYSDYGAR